jgi:putative SOS response-associated peptidase YedK
VTDDRRFVECVAEDQLRFQVGGNNRRRRLQRGYHRAVCGRFSQAESSRRLAAIFGAELDGDLPDGKYNVVPTDQIRIVIERRGDERLLTAADWGFRPFWRQSKGTAAPGWINAKAETAAESPAFRRALREQRCIIPADAFYEWDRGHRPPQPYAIGPAEPGGLLALAGIWTQTKHGELTTAAILTTGPNQVMERLHHRMPVIVEHEDVQAWLAADAPLDEIMPLLTPVRDDALRVWPVSTAVNSVRNDGPHLLTPIEEVASTLGLA